MGDIIYMDGLSESLLSNSRAGRQRELDIFPDSQEADVSLEMELNLSPGSLKYSIRGYLSDEIRCSHFSRDCIHTGERALLFFPYRTDTGLLVSSCDDYSDMVCSIFDLITGMELDGKSVHCRDYQIPSAAFAKMERGSARILERIESPGIEYRTGSTEFDSIRRFYFSHRPEVLRSYAPKAL